MNSATAYVIRDIRADDVPQLVRLGWATHGEWPSGQIIVGEIHGVIAAALAVDEDRSVLADMPAAPRLLAHLRVRAAGIRAHQRTLSVADRIRERMGRRAPLDA
jgi:IS5 family transposase